MDRGQAYTLEAIIAALLLLAAITFAIDMTAVTPLSASTSNQHIENQQQGVARGVLAASDEAGGLEEMVLYWDNASGSFHGAPDVGYFTNDPPNSTLGDMLERSFDDNDVAYNVYVTFASPSGDQIRKRVVYRGVPSNHAVRVSRTVTVTDQDRIYDADGTRNATAVHNASTFYAADVGDVVYNVFTVEVVAWRV